MRLRILVSAFACQPGAGSGPVLGGGEDQLGWNLVKQIARFCHVWVLTSAQNRAGIEEALRREPLPGMQCHYVELPRWLRRLKRVQGGIQIYAYLWQVKAYFTARHLHQRVQFDMFHHITYANDWMASFIGALLPILYIRGPGGGAHRTPKAFLGEYSFCGRLWEHVRVLGQWLLRRDPFFRAGQKRARAILVCNREAQQAIPRKLQSKVHLFPVNGITASDLSLCLSANPSGNHFCVLTAGKLLRLKGVALAMRAFKAFLERSGVASGPEEPRFTIVGDGPELPRLQDLANRLGLQRQVRFEKWMLREDVLLKMASCDVFLFPSLRDGGGAVAVEAMAAAKPVICFDLAGPGMHVADGCGIRIKPESPEQAVRDMAAALELLYKDRELRSQMGRAARTRAEQAYHWDRLGEQLMEIYQKSLGNKVIETQWERH